jgi:hypothetical protein
MTVDVRWLDETQQILYWELSKNWTFEEFRQAIDRSKAMVTDIDNFDLILNSNNTLPPANALQGFLGALRDASPKQDRMVLVNSHVLAKTLVQVLQRIQAPKTEHQQLFFADTVEEAQQLILREREQATDDT